MGKKTNNTKTAAPAGRTAKSKPAAEKVVPRTPTRAKPKTTVRSAKPAIRRTRKPSFSQEDVALRAYFIAERRQVAGVPGNSHQDWIEAERQLASEARKPVKSKPKKKA